MKQCRVVKIIENKQLRFEVQFQGPNSNWITDVVYYTYDDYYIDHSILNRINRMILLDYNFIGLYTMKEGN